MMTHKSENPTPPPPISNIPTPAMTCPEHVTRDAFLAALEAEMEKAKMEDENHLDALEAARLDIIEAMKTIVCEFCGKTDKQVHKMIAGPRCYICEECIELCMDIIQEPSEDNDPT